MGKKSRRKEKERSRLDRLAGQNTALSSKQDVLKKQCKMLRKKHKSLAAGYQAILDGSKELHTKISELQSKYSRATERMQQERQRAKKIRHRLERLQSRQEAEQHQINALHQQLEQQAQVTESLPERLAGVEQLARQGALLQEQLEQLYTDKAGLDDQIASLISHVIDLETGHKNLGSTIGDLSGALDEVVSRADEQLGKYQSLDTRLNALEQTNPELLRHVKQLQVQAADVKENLSASEQRMANRAAAIEKQLQQMESEYGRLLKDGLNRHQERIQGLIESAEAYNNTSRETAELIQSLQEQAVNQKDKLVSLEERLAVRYAELEKAIENLDSEHRQRLEENKGQQRRMMENWVESLNRAESDVLQKVDQQRIAVEQLAGKTGRLEQAQNTSTQASQLLQKQVGGFRKVLISGVKRLAKNDADLEKHSQELALGLQNLAQRHRRLARNAFAGGVLLLGLGGMGVWALLNQMDHPPALLSEVAEQPRASTPIEVPQQISKQSGDVDENTQRIEQLETAWEDLRNQLAVLENRQSGWRATIEQHEEKLRLMEEQHRSILNQIESQSKAVVTPRVPNTVRHSAWLRSLDPTHFTIQILASHDAASVSRVAARQDLQASKAIYTRRSSSGDWHLLLYGDFPSFRRATAALQRLPEDIRANDPWIRKLASVQNELDN